VISRRYQPAPVYHALLKQDGVHLPSPEQTPTTVRTARTIMQSDVPFVLPEMSVEDAWRWALEHDADVYLVGTRDHLVGSVARQRLEEWHTTGHASDRIGSLIEPTFVHAHPDHSIDVVLDRLSESGGALPIVSRTEARRVEGIVTLNSILAAAGRQNP
jgi:CBS domain-containing protein